MACDNEFRKLHWNKINDGLMLGLSVIIALDSSFIRIEKRRRKARVENGI